MNAARRVVLFVLERPDLRTHFNQALLRTPHSAIFCFDGADGFDRFLEARPDVCLVCESTARINGAILCRLIKQHRWSHGVGVYLMSAHPADPSLQALIASTGIDGVLPLPPPSDLLFEVLMRPHAFQPVESGEAELAAEAEVVDEEPPRNAPVEVDASEVFTEHRGDERMLLVVRPPQETTNWDAAASGEHAPVELTPGMRKSTAPDLAAAPIFPPEVAPAALQPPADELTPVLASPLPGPGAPDPETASVEERTGPARDPSRLLSQAAVLSAIGAGVQPVVPVPVAGALAAPEPVTDPGVQSAAGELTPDAASPAVEESTPAGGQPAVEEPTPVTVAPKPLWGPGAQRRPADEEGGVFAAPDQAPPERETTIPGAAAPVPAVPVAAPDADSNLDYSGIYPLAPDERDSATLRRAISESQLGGRLTRRVLALYRLIDAVDYYQLLGVSSAADARAMQDAYHALAREYHPDRFFALVPGVIKERIASLFRRINEAYSVLSRPERRQRYDEVLGQRGAGPPPRLPLGEGQAPGAEGGTEAQTPVGRKYLRLAFAALARGDLDAAHLNLSFAVGHEPDNEMLRRRLDALDHELQASR